MNTKNIESVSDEETKVPKPKPRKRLAPNPHELLTGEKSSPVENLSTPPLLPKHFVKNSHSNLTSPGVSSTIQKFENVSFDHKNPSTLPRNYNKAPPSKLPENNSPIISADNDQNIHCQNMNTYPRVHNKSPQTENPETKSPTSEGINQGAYCSKTNNLYEDLPVHDENNHSQSLLRSESVPARNGSSNIFEYIRNTVNFQRYTEFGDQKYMDLYSILNEKDSKEISDDESSETYRVARLKLLTVEQEYYFQLQKINILFYNSRAKYSLQTIDMQFGDISGLLSFHEKMLTDMKTCDTMPELAKLIVDRELEYDIYIKDKWLKVTKGEKSNGIFVPYNNWAETHLEFYNNILKQLVQYKNPSIIFASIIINETIDQRKAVEWLSEIEDFPTMKEAGMFLLKDKFKIKNNGKDKGTQEVIFLENYILCVSSVNDIKKCFLSFKVSDITMTKKKSDTLEVKIIGAKSNTILNSSDSKTINTWFNRYLFRSFECMKATKTKK